MKNELFGESIKDIRLNLNLTQNQVAETANINRITISRIENEVIPDLTTLEYLSLIYKCNLVELYSNNLFLNISNICSIIKLTY